VVCDPAVLAIDAGSSRIRASFVALADGAVIDSRLGPPLPVVAELDLETLWQDLVGTVGELDRGGVDIRAIGVAAQLGMVLLDERGQPVRPALAWSDKRAVGEAGWLAETVNDGVLAATGRPVAPELWLARLRWLAAHESASLRRTRWVLSLKDALVHRLTGRVVCDEASASYSGLFDVYARAWSPTLVDAAGIDIGVLPPLVSGVAVAGELSIDAAASLGLPAGLVVAGGGPDGTTGAIGAGAVRPGVTVDVAGTTDVLLHTAAAPVRDSARRIVLNAHAIPGLWTVGGPTGLTGAVVQWTASLLGYASVADAERELGTPQPAGHSSADGPIFLTALGGSRFPTWRANSTGLIADLRLEHGPGALFRAAQEGVAFTLAEGLDTLRGLGLEVGEVIVVGGGAARPAGLQLRSDAWGLPVVSLANREATTIGTAMLAGVAASWFTDPDGAARSLVRPARRYEPQRAVAEALARARRRWRAADERQAALET
jgi:xylulokinase